MRALLLGLAALAATAIPAGAGAQHFTGSDFAGVQRGHDGRFGDFRSHPRFGSDFFCGVSGDFRRGRDGRDRHRDGRRHRRDIDVDCDVFAGGWGAPYAWALYNNRTWESDSYNDWWHDRPDRAFPRWVRTNRGCTPDRMWWSGSGWRC